MMRMAAIYARVSSEQQREENTIASQTASLIEFARSHDLEVPGEWVFEDEGYSGATLERPGLERVRDLAAEGQIQVVLAYAPDRLSRKYAYQILVIEEFAHHGVETVFVKSPQGDSAEDQLLVQFQGMIAEYERAQILERSRRGKRHRAHAGEISVMSGAPYGYRYIRKTDEAPAAYSVHEAEARVVRRVYEMARNQKFEPGSEIGTNNPKSHNNSSLCPCQYQRLVRTSAVMCLERRFWPLASSRWPGTTTTAGIYRVTLSTPQPLPRSSAELRFSSVGPRKRVQSSLVRFILSSAYCACHKSSPNRRSTIAGATSSSSSPRDRSGDRL